MIKSLPELILPIQEKFRCLTIADAMAEIQHNDGIMIDVREEKEASTKPVNISKTLPRGILEMRVTQLTKEPDRAIYLHCASGVRATLAAQQLDALGYTCISIVISSIDEICQYEDKLVSPSSKGDVR